MHSEEVVLAVAAVLVIGVAAQWVGVRLRVPPIVFLLGAGLLLGPITGWLDPDRLLGDGLFPFVSLAVAVVLFEGASSLGAGGVRAAGRTVWLLLTVGAGVTLVLTAVVAHLVLDVPWSLAWVLSGVLVVTGPTVIGPVVRSIGLRGRVAAILEAEGTLVDPLGAIVTVLLFQALYEQGSGGVISLELLATFAIGIAVGLAAAALLLVALARFWVPDELHNLTTLTLVVVAFALADGLRPEAGLVATTVMGFALASQRRVEVTDVLAFNETLRTLFIAGLFVLLGARITRETLTELEWRNVAFLVLLVVLVRPVAVLVATARSPLGWRQRAFIAATAPRGIVAAAVASILSLRLADQGAEGGQVIVSATFTVIVGTVLLSGLGARGLARRLDLVGDGREPVVVLGTNAFGRELAEALERHDVPVRLVSLNRTEVSTARLAGLSAVHGSVLDDALWSEIEEGGASAFVAVTGKDEVDVLACRRAATLVDRRHVFRVAPGRREHSRLPAPASAAGRHLVGDIPLGRFEELLERGWRVRGTPLTDAFDGDDYRSTHPGAVVVGAIRRNGVDLAAGDVPLRLRPGDVVLGLTQARVT
jgi:NhaP-type Na+/H+ or K+/H+ antiporter